MNNQLASLRELQRQKYEAHKRMEKVKLYSSISKDFSRASSQRQELLGGTMGGRTCKDFGHQEIGGRAGRLVG